MKSVFLLPDSQPYAVGKIVCLGKNYTDHAKEMGGDLSAQPVLFLKPPSAIIHDGDQIVLPKKSSNVHHEIELTILIGIPGKRIPKDEARSHIAGFGLGLDLTMRDVQLAAKRAGNPWAVSKGFDTSAPLTDFVAASKIPDPDHLEIRLTVNGKVRQHSNTERMILSVDSTVSYVSEFFSLDAGDIIYTGTPEGVGQIVAGDDIFAEIPGVGSLHHVVVGEN